MNEHQVVIGETTGGREELVDPKGLIDYGSLMHRSSKIKVCTRSN
jgi:hypothetical protein